MFTESELHRKDVSGRVVIIYLKLNIYFVRKLLFFFLHARAHTQTKDQKLNNPELTFKVFNTRMPRAPLLYLSVCLSVTPAVSEVRGADEQQKNKFGPTYFKRLQYF